MIGFTQIYRFDVEIIISTLFAQESHRFCLRCILRQ